MTAHLRIGKAHYQPGQDSAKGGHNHGAYAARKERREQKEQAALKRMLATAPTATPVKVDPNTLTPAQLAHFKATVGKIADCYSKAPSGQGAGAAQSITYAITTIEGQTKGANEEWPCVDRPPRRAPECEDQTRGFLNAARRDLGRLGTLGDRESALLDGRAATLFAGPITEKAIQDAFGTKSLPEVQALRARAPMMQDLGNNLRHVWNAQRCYWDNICDRMDAGRDNYLALTETFRTGKVADCHEAELGRAVNEFNALANPTGSPTTFPTAHPTVFNNTGFNGTDAPTFFNGTRAPTNANASNAPSFSPTEAASAPSFSPTLRVTNVPTVPGTTKEICAADWEKWAYAGGGAAVGTMFGMLGLLALQYLCSKRNPKPQHTAHQQQLAVIGSGAER